MGRGATDDPTLGSAKSAYRAATSEGNHYEEARWANVIGDILKNKGEYCEALKWLRIDYEVSTKFLPQKQLLATCQSLGEVHLRLQSFDQALFYQNKHLELAKDSDDIVEQQRASTQLGRTYHEKFLQSNDDHCSLRNAKKYFQSAMNLAKTLKENPPDVSTSFLKEYIDAHNNIGMLEIELDNYMEAEKILKKGLRICDEEEIVENDDGRTRLHHNLGKVYLELRKWEDAKTHIEKDISICNSIGHCQGEAKGFINLGELHYRVQKCDEAINCYERALKLAKSMEDEGALVQQIRQNIKTVKQAKQVSDELKKGEQNLKKLIRSTHKARGTGRERKCLMKQNAYLDRLIEKSSSIAAWLKHRVFAREKMRVATELCDKEKLCDSLQVLGESYQQLRKFSEALQLYTKSLEMAKSIGSLEGQAVAKINIGDVLDCDGDWEGALRSFEEGYRIAKEANLLSIQLDALENMHYSHMIRFNNVDEARKMQLLIDKLKESLSGEHAAAHVKKYCSETDTEEDDEEISGSDMSSSYNTKNSDIQLGQSESEEENFEDVPIISFKTAKQNASKLKAPRSPLYSGKQTYFFPEKPTGSQRELGSRKRIRVILSDDEEDEAQGTRNLKGRHHEASREEVATSGESKSMDNNAHRVSEVQANISDVSVVASKSATRSGSPFNFDESICSRMSRSSEVGNHGDPNLPTLGTGVATNSPAFNGYGTKPYADVSGSLSHGFFGVNEQFCHGQCGLMLLHIDKKFVHLDPGSCIVGGKLSIECMKIKVACLYYLQLPEKKRSEGRFPIIQHMSCGGRVLDSLEEVNILEDHSCGKGWIDVSVDGWVKQRMMKLYIDCCCELSQPPDMKILKKLYNSEVSEDEVIVSDCDLKDESISPLLTALQIHKTTMVLDLSHNLLGTGTLEKLKKVLASGQQLGGFVLDLHQNILSPSSLIQICESPVLFSRLEVLNVSGNRLTDGSAFFLSSILQNCKALYSLSVERCSITSKTIQKIADALHTDSVLTHIAIGYNFPVSPMSIISLLDKLATLKRFSDLNLSGLKLGKPVVNSLCQLIKSSCFETLRLGDTSLGTESALQLTQSFDANQELVRLDLSSCRLTSQYVAHLNTMISSLVELDLGGNPIMQEGGNVMVSLLKNPRCCLKILVLNKCQLGLSGVVRILQALQENGSLEELNLAHNLNAGAYQMPCDTSFKIPSSEEVDAAEQRSVEAKIDCDNLEVADSEDDPMAVEPTDCSDDCVNSSERNIHSQDSSLVQELSTAIGMAKNLNLLDLSNNMLSKEMTEVLYAAWSSFSRAGLAQRHIQENIIHFSVQGYKCCGVKSCCRKVY